MGTPSFSTIKKWAAEFNVAVPALKMIHMKDVQKVQQHQKSLNKCMMWYWMFGGWKCVKLLRLGISKEHVGYILHEKLDMKKLCARWVPRLLTADEKRTRMKISESWSVLTKLKLILCINLLLWMRLGFTITHHNPNSS